jgi:hypothetical protein
METDVEATRAALIMYRRKKRLGRFAPQFSRILRYEGADKVRNAVLWELKCGEVEERTDGMRIGSYATLPLSVDRKNGRDPPRT